MMSQISCFEDIKIIESKKKNIVNVASVPQRSPFRYPGGKTWFVPFFRKWAGQIKRKNKTLIEPFAGGGIISLTAACENLFDKILMVEMDDEVAAVWSVIINGDANRLASKILNFDLNVNNVQIEFAKENKNELDIAFSTILKNRVNHGGIIAKGSGLLKHGENGKGIQSRWYPKTLYNRILAIEQVKDKISFVKDDAFKIIKEYKDDKDSNFFIDPPYTVAGKRLYTHFNIEHELLMRESSSIKGDFLITYDDVKDINDLAEKHKLKVGRVPMKTTMHEEKYELVISNSVEWLNK